MRVSPRAVLGVPLVLRERVLGALFACKRQERQFTADEVNLLSALAAHAAVAIDNAATIERLNRTNPQRELADENTRLRRQQRITTLEQQAVDVLSRSDTPVPRCLWPDGRKR